MRPYKTLPLIICCALALLPFPGSKAAAQSGESAEVQLKGKQYLEINLHKLEKFERQQKRRQQHLIARLQKQERHLKASLFKSDSLAWKRYNEQGLSPDSLAALAKRDTAYNTAKSIRSANSRIDSLRGVTRFLSNAAGNTGQADASGLYGGQIDQLQGRLDYRKRIDELIAKRTAGLANLDGSVYPAVNGMQKQLYYAKAQIKEYQALADDPDKAEAKAYEFLQGMPGFNEQIDASVNGVNPLAAMGNSNISSADLERMGFQTRRQVGAALEQKFGTNMGAVQQQLGGQLDAWKTELNKSRELAAGLRHASSELKHLADKGIHINPMRCKPFWQRVQRTYDFQTTRPTVDGKPATLQVGGMLAYRQSPKFKAGLGIAAITGLGQGWTAIHLSFEGLAARSFLSYELQWGIHLYGGYERLYKRATFGGTAEAPTNTEQYSTHDRPGYSEKALLGLTKAYKLSANRMGEIQLLYDCWWAEKSLRSPFLLRYNSTF